MSSDNNSGHQQLSFDLIPHQVEDGNVINQRASDGYIHATALCRAVGREWNHYWDTDRTQAFIAELAIDTKLPPATLVHVIRGGRSSGTWVHPQVAINLAQWLSPRFAVQVSKWVHEWMSGGGVPARSAMPVHLQRYVMNQGAVPVTHFSMLNELIFGLIAPLEASGYTLPERMMPDISEGRMFSDWIRKNKNVDPCTFPTYSHRFQDGRVVQARLYPNEYLAEFRAHFNGVWLPQKASSYFSDRDPAALPHLPKLLGGPRTT